MCLKPYGIVFPNLIRVMALPIESEEFCQSCMVMNERNTLGLKIKNHMDCFQVIPSDNTIRLSKCRTDVFGTLKLT